MTENASAYDVSAFTSRQLDVLAQEIEAQKPFSNYFYRVIRFFAHNLLFIWVLCVLPYLPLHLYTKTAIGIAAFLLSNFIARTRAYEKMTIREMLQRYAEIGVEDRDISKKKRRRYYISMFNWACVLYLPFIAVLWMERNHIIAVELSMWIQMVVAWSWIAAFMAFSHTHFKWQSLGWDTRNHKGLETERYEKREKKIWFGLLILMLSILALFLGGKTIVEYFGLFGQDASLDENIHRKWRVYAPIVWFLWPMLVMAGYFYLNISNKILTVAFSLKKQLDKLWPC